MLVLALLAGSAAFAAAAGITVLLSADQTDRDRKVVLALAIAFGIGVALSKGHPTGIDGLDVVLRFLFGAVITFLAARASKASLLASALVMAVVSVHSPLQAVAFV